ncbi:hypothetical protein HHL11_03985 [Ramlibacter sp. G-1-2-2]|uniref:Uncharacterized protein n=1 Tax=Ramlibacter agri TaxID=2728837 RepID=A0A848GXL9_9BURK|nr:hypothetical protein [Ramlibacter agri]NML42897.1 hypothetical protein [Ramlibacter agri]
MSSVSFASATPADAVETAHDPLFLGGPAQPLQAWLRLAAAGRVLLTRRILLFLLLTWVPLLPLAAAEGRLWTAAGGPALLTDYGAWARFVFAGPMLLAAEAVAGEVLSRIARRFAALWPAGDPGRVRFQHVAEAVRRQRDAVTPAIVMTVLASLLAWAVAGMSVSQLPPWHRSAADPALLSPAGWWAAVVSLPLLLLLVMSWLWRLFLWSRFLWQVAQLDLPLLPVHPDKAAGIGFAGLSLRGFGLVGTAIGTLVAGAMANAVMHDGAAMADMKHGIAATVIVSVALFTAPLLAFTPRLWREWQRGAREYDGLAHELGQQFEQRWFAGRRPVEGVELLDQSDYSAACDLYSVVDRVRDMRWVPVNLHNVVILAAATLAPFVPVALMVMPVDAVLKTLAGLLR